MNRNPVAPDQLFGVDVIDSAGNQVGAVDGVWVDDATDELEFVGVKLGFIAGKTHLIPTADAQVSSSAVTIPYGKDQVKDAPSFGTDEELSPENEDAIYSYYGLDRSTAPSPSGLATGSDRNWNTSSLDTDRSTVREDDRLDANRDQSLTLHKEELQVGKREVEAGRVRIRKVVRTEHQEVPVELRREEIEIERIPATGDVSDGTAFREQEIDVPVTHEEAVVNKESHATEEVRLRKTAEVETETVGGDVRREEVEVDRDFDQDAPGTDRARRDHGI